VPYATPKLRALRIVAAPWDRQETTAAAATDAPPEPATSATVGSQTLGASTNQATISNSLPTEATAKPEALDPAVLAKIAGSLAVEDPTGHALDAFYASLARTAKKEPGAVTRILHYGDSVIASDFISGTARRRMQEKFGDAGHGFILAAKAWDWYFHNDVAFHNDGDWKASKLAGPITDDGFYGLAGVSIQSYGGGVSHFGTMSKGDFGRKVSRFDIYYLEQPSGGDLEIKIKNGGGHGPDAFGAGTQKLSTRGDAKLSKVFSVRVPDGEATMSIRALSNVRLFGVALERDVPGVVYDALGAHAAMAVYWKRQDAQHWRDQMALRKPALVVVQYGTNESDLWKIDWDEYEKNLGDVLDMIKNAAGGASVLVMAPMDRAERGAGGALVTKPVVLRLREVQHRVAIAKGLAFWDTFTAMGGEGSMAKWVKAEPQLGGGDLTHPTPAGAEVLGNLFAKALITGYDAYASKSQ
jgi:lysophospholipase L1-like esterase